MRNEKDAGQNSLFAYLGSYLAIPKDFEKFAIKIFKTAKNRIGEGTYLETSKAIDWESRPPHISKRPKNALSYYISY